MQTLQIETRNFATIGAGILAQRDHGTATGTGRQDAPIA
jgi:hypothetical protein